MYYVYILCKNITDELFGLFLPDLYVLKSTGLLSLLTPKKFLDSTWTWKLKGLLAKFKVTLTVPIFTGYCT